MVLIQEAIPSRREVTRRALPAWSANTSFKSSSRPDVTWREVLDFQPASPLQFDAKEFAMCPREAVWLWARTLGCINKTLHACLDDELFPQLFTASEDFDRPSTVGRALMVANMTALQEPDGGVRGIATDFRRLLAKCGHDNLARRWNQCANHHRSLTGINSKGVHVYWSAMLAKLLEVLELQGILSFARVWEDGGPRNHIRHGEGGEQGGCPSWVCNVLAAGKSRMASGEHVLVFARAPCLNHNECDPCILSWASRRKGPGSSCTQERPAFGIGPQDIDDLGKGSLEPRRSERAGVFNRIRRVHPIFHRQETRGGTKTVVRDPVSSRSPMRMAVAALMRRPTIVPPSRYEAGHDDLSVGCLSRAKNRF